MSPLPKNESTRRQYLLRLHIITNLGGRCNNPECKWLNEDGTMGCTDIRALQIDHIDGDGNKQLRSGRGGGLVYYRIVRDDIKYSALSNTRCWYQLLCANCNWIKRHTNHEAQGFLQHR